MYFISNYYIQLCTIDKNTLKEQGLKKLKTIIIQVYLH